MSKRRGSGSPPRKRRLAAAVLLAGYLFGVILGCFVIWIIPIVKNRADLLEIADNKGHEVLSAGRLDEVMIYGMEHWLFSERGQLVSRQSTFLHQSQEDEIRAVYSAVLEKGELFRPCFFWLDNREEEPTRVFGIIVGTTVESSGGKPFASVLLRDLSDLETTMITYVALYTILYLVGVFFTVITIRKERQLFRMRRDLIANVSHELKTPITSIRAMAEALHDGMIKDHKTKQVYSAKIIEETDRLEQLVLDILELSKLQSNGAEFKKILVHADGLFPPIIDRYMMLCGDLGITLDVSTLDLNSIPALYTDPKQLTTLLSILLDNAVKFSGAGGSIRITRQLHSKSVTFCIKDNGPGIRSEDVPRIFERFYKADTAHNTSGSGLGLAIANEIVKGLGERIWVESTYGAGTSFFFTIGLKSSAQQYESVNS